MPTTAKYNPQGRKQQQHQYDSHLSEVTSFSEGQKARQILGYRGCVYDVDHRNPELCSIQLEAIYDLTPIDNAMYRKGIHGLSTVLF